MHSRRWIFGLIMGLALALALTGCGALRPEAETVDSTATSEAPVEGQATLTPAAPDTGDTPAATLEPDSTPDETNYEEVSIPEAGLQVEVPADWQQQAPDYTWSPAAADGEEAAEVGVAWVELQAPQEPEAALLPEGAQILESEVVDTDLGVARSFLVEVYGPAPEGGAQAPVESVELHILILTIQEDRRIAYDFYAAAPTREALGNVGPRLAHMLESATFLGAVETELPAPATDSGTGTGEAPQATADKARAILAQHLDVAEDEIELVSAEYVEWPDGCLGIRLPDRSCTQAIVPGYRFIFSAGARNYEVRTDTQANSAAVVPDFVPN